MSKQKQKGTSWESAIVRYLHEQGFPQIERRALNGIHDRGDISGLPGVVIEAKNHAHMTLGPWVEEAAVERLNDDARIAVVWHKRIGKGSPGDCYVTMTGRDFVELLREGSW